MLRRPRGAPPRAAEHPPRGPLADFLLLESEIANAVNLLGSHSDWDDPPEGQQLDRIAEHTGKPRPYMLYRMALIRSVISGERAARITKAAAEARERRQRPLLRRQSSTGGQRTGPPETIPVQAIQRPRFRHSRSARSEQLFPPTNICDLGPTGTGRGSTPRA